MLKATFNNGKNINVTLESSTDNFVTLIGKTGANTSGFQLRRISDGFLLGDYSDFTTIYEKVEGGYTFTNIPVKEV